MGRFRAEFLRSIINSGLLETMMMFPKQVSSILMRYKDNHEKCLVSRDWGEENVEWKEDNSGNGNDRGRVVLGIKEGPTQPN